MPGPIPKRSDERVRRNQPDVPIEKITQIGPVAVPDLGLFNPHQLAVDMYESLKESGQSRFYEPSDWQVARLAMLVLDEMLKNAKGIPTMKLATWLQMTTSLLMTEGDRRRARLEVERNQDAGEGAKVLQVADLFRRQLKNQGLGEG